MKAKEFKEKLEKLGCGFLLKESPLFNLDEGNYSEYHLETLMEIVVMSLEKIFYKGDEFELKNISFREVTVADKEFIEGQNIYILTYIQLDKDSGNVSEFNIGDINITPAICGYDYQEQEKEGYIPLKEMEEKYGEYYGIIHHFFDYYTEVNIRLWSLYNQDRIETMKIGDSIKFPHKYNDWAELTLLKIDSRDANREFTKDPRECMRSSDYYFECKTDSGKTYYESLDSNSFKFTLYSDRKKFC